MASESARERAERWLAGRRTIYVNEGVIASVARLLDEHARAELGAAADASGEPGGPHDLRSFQDWLRARAARIGGGE